MNRMPRGPLLTAGLVLALTGMTGCASYLINATAERAAEVQVKRFKLHIHRVDPFVQCLERPGGMCPVDDAGDGAVGFFSGDPIAPTAQQALSTRTDGPDRSILDAADGDLRGGMEATLVAAELARDVLNHPVQAQLNAIFSVAKGALPADLDPDLADGAGFATAQAASGETRAMVRLDLDSFADYQEKVEAATLMDAWEALDREADLFDAPLDPDRQRRHAYIRHYFQAYFRNGKFFQARINGAQLKSEIMQKLASNFPGLDDEAYGEWADDLFPHYNFDPENTEYVFGQIADTGFVTRDGQQIAFPGLEASLVYGERGISFTHVDYIAVGSDLIRVLLHAIYDANQQLPAVSNASGITVPFQPLVENQPASAEAPGTQVDEEEFQRIQTRAVRVEAVVSAGTGRLVRGVSFLSLNNEALATAIETAVGLAVRKQIEKVMWCWYQCRFNELEDVGDFAATSYGDEIELVIEVGGFPQQTIRGSAEQD